MCLNTHSIMHGAVLQHQPINNYSDVISMLQVGGVRGGKAGTGVTVQQTEPDNTNIYVHLSIIRSRSGRGGGGGEAVSQTRRQKIKVVLSVLPCREMNELAREPRSLYPAFHRETKEREGKTREERKKRQNE